MIKPRKRTDTYAMFFTIRDRAGAAVDTTGYTVTVNVVEREPPRTVKVANAACVAVTPAAGRWKWVPTAPDVNTSMAYDLEVKAVAPDGTIYHVPTAGYEALYIRDNLG